jgi:hypothetical protein
MSHTGTAFDDVQSVAAAGPLSPPNQVLVRVAMLHRFCCSIVPTPMEGGRARP